MIDSISSPYNVLYTDDTNWTPADFQFKVWAAWDDSNVYFAAKVLRDDVYGLCGSSTTWICGCDNFKINPGGQAAMFYLFSNGQIFRTYYNPWQQMANLQFKVNPHGGENGLPSYECSLNRIVLDSFIQKPFQLLVGSEDEDAGSGTCGNETFLFVGLEYKGNIHIPRESEPIWDYPTYTLSSTVGASILTEAERSKPARSNSIIIDAHPNPVNSVATISFANPNQNAMITITDIKGRTVARFNNLTGNRITWNGRNESNGTYFVKLESGKSVLTKKICIIK